MSYLHKKITTNIARYVVHALVLFVLVTSSIANASAEATSMCNEQPSNMSSMMDHDAMGSGTMAIDDCCQVDVMPDCCNTCHANVYSVFRLFSFSVDKPNSIELTSVENHHFSTHPSPLFRPPRIS